MEDEEEDDVTSFGGGGSGRNKKSSSKPAPKIPPPPPQITKDDEKWPPDLLPGTKRTDFEWTVEEGVMRTVVDQGNRRVCWTIASSRELSGRLVVAKRFNPPLCFSALHLLVGLIDKVGEKGGLKKLEDLRRFLIDEGAILEEDCTCPQLALQLKDDTSKPNPIVCTMENKAAKHVRRFKVHDLTIRKRVDETEIMRLLQTGPVAVSIDVHEEFTKFKGDGVYPGSPKGSTRLDKHLFIVYGYGTIPENGRHYWKVQNSAGTKWGNNGYGKIVRQCSRPRGEPSVFKRIVYSTLLDNYEGQMVQVAQRGRHA